MDITTYILSNPFAFVGLVWLILPVGIGVISFILLVLDMQEIVQQWNKSLKKVGLPKLLFIIFTINLSIACVWGIIHIFIHVPTS